MTNDTTLVAEDEFVARLQDPSTREKAFEELVGTYQQRLYWHIRRMVLDHDDTDDVLQNTFIKVFRNIDSFKGDSKLYSWMYRIATNEALSFMKQKSRKLGVSSLELQEKMVDKLESDVYFEGGRNPAQTSKSPGAIARKAKAGVQYEVLPKYEVR